MNNSLVDNLALGGYWNEFCFVCQKQTYQPEGFCSACGWDDSVQEFMTEERYNETIGEVGDRVYARSVNMEFHTSRSAAKSK